MHGMPKRQKNCKTYRGSGKHTGSEVAFKEMGLKGVGVKFFH